MALFEGLIRKYRSFLLLCAWAFLGMAAVNICAEEPTSLTNRQGVLLLTSNRLVEGRISHSAVGYVVVKQFGTLVIPFDQVRLTAWDRGEAFRKLKAMLPKKNADTNVSLAQWCMTYGLYSECRAELRDALALQPDRDDARKLLKRVEEILNPSKPVHLVHPVSPRRTQDGFLAREARSLAGLSPESARNFVIRVQPILMNKCGNASCHGSMAANEFRLTRVGFGRRSHRMFAERNLSAVLKFVDLKTPDNSPLLRVPKGSHGRGGRVVFYGPHGKAQWESLRDWVRTIAKELPSTSAKKPLFNRNTARLDLSTHLELKPISEFSVKKQNSNSTINPLPKNSETTSAALQNLPKISKSGKIDLIRAILEEERRDAFDPEEFNRSSKAKDSKNP
ncbi:MAG: hypothetical protein IH899_13985 [Planctomycetes bacterium]|nr:hypothetical protein [Planctomycetota bacterium]